MIWAFTYLVFSLFYFEIQSTVIKLLEESVSKQSLKDRAIVKEKAEKIKRKRKLFVFWPYFIFKDLYIQLFKK